MVNDDEYFNPVFMNILQMHALLTILTASLPIGAVISIIFAEMTSTFLTVL